MTQHKPYQPHEIIIYALRWQQMKEKAPPPLTPRKPQTNKPLESEEGEKIADKRSHKLINEINNKS